MAALYVLKRNHEEMFPRYYMRSNTFNIFKRINNTTVYLECVKSTTNITMHVVQRKHVSKIPKWFWIIRFRIYINYFRNVSFILLVVSGSWTNIYCHDKYVPKGLIDEYGQITPWLMVHHIQVTPWLKVHHIQVIPWLMVHHMYHYQGSNTVYQIQRLELFQRKAKNKYVLYYYYWIEKS